MGHAKSASTCWQFAVQPSPDSVLPSSHFSSTWLILPSPQTMGGGGAASGHDPPSQSSKGSTTAESPRLITPVPVEVLLHPPLR